LNELNKIETFWKWFFGIENQYRKFFTEEEVNTQLLIEAMNNRVLDFGQFKWEMREGKQGVLQFIISPNGDHELFELSQKIMAEASPHPNWQFLPALPPEKTDYKFQIYDEGMRLCEIDATDWNCFLEKEVDGLIGATILAENIQNLDEDTQVEAAEKLLKKILGEEMFINYIAGLGVVDEFTENEEEGAFPLNDLIWKFDELVEN